MKNFLIYIFPVFLIAALVVNNFIGEPEFKSPKQQLEHYTQLGDHQNKRQVYLMLLKADSLNIDLHFEYLLAHFQGRKSRFSWEEEHGRDDSQLFLKYKKYLTSDQEKLRNIGHFGLGIVFYFLRLYDECFFELHKIENQDFKYLNYFYGSFYHYFDYHKSLQYYNQELLNFPENKIVYQRKANLMMQFQKIDELENFLADSIAKLHVGHREKRYTYFYTKNIQSYFTTIVERVVKGSNLIGFVGAFFILVIWLFYLLMINKSKSLSMFFVLMSLVLGMLFAFGTSFLTDFNKYILDFDLKGEWKNDFVYSIVGIGLIEELIKVLPFLCLLLFNKNIKEPIDYVFYASVTALGFAFVENIIYFDSSGIKTIQGRALTATVTHMFHTSLIAYGIVIGKFSKKKNTFAYFFLFFLIASFSHGFYDFWLMNVLSSKLSFLTFLWLLITMMIWSSIINNCINNSFNTQPNWKYDPVKINRFLLFSLSFIFLFQYVFVGVKFGAVVANYELKKDMASGMFLLLFLTINLSKMDYIPNYWAPLKFWDWDVFLNIPMVSPVFFKVEDVLNARVKISTFAKYGKLANHLPIEGEIVSRELLSWEKDWYLVKLENELKIGWKSHQYMLVKSRYSNEVILSKKHQVVQVRAVPDQKSLSKRKKYKKDFPFIDLGRIEKLLDS